MYLAIELLPDVAVPGTSNMGVRQTPLDELDCIKNIQTNIIFQQIQNTDFLISKGE